MKRFIFATVALLCLAFLPASPASANDVATFGHVVYPTAFGDVKCPFSMILTEGIPTLSGPWQSSVRATPQPGLPHGCNFNGTDVDGWSAGKYALQARTGTYCGGDPGTQWRQARNVLWTSPSNTVYENGTMNCSENANAKIQLRVCAFGGYCTAWVTKLTSNLMM